MEHRESTIDRRDFIKSASATGVGLMLSSRVAPLFAASPGDKITVGVMGLNGRGIVHAKTLARTNNVELAAHQSERPARPRLPTKPQNPGTRSSRQGRTTVSSPDNGSAYRSTIHAIACHTLGIRHLRTRPYRPQTNGKACVLVWCCRPVGR